MDDAQPTEPTSQGCSGLIFAAKLLSDNLELGEGCLYTFSVQLCFNFASGLSANSSSSGIFFTFTMSCFRVFDIKLKIFTLSELKFQILTPLWWTAYETPGTFSVFYLLFLPGYLDFPVYPRFRNKLGFVRRCIQNSYLSFLCSCISLYNFQHFNYPAFWILNQWDYSFLLEF